LSSGSPVVLFTYAAIFEEFSPRIEQRRSQSQILDLAMIGLSDSAKLPHAARSGSTQTLCHCMSNTTKTRQPRDQNVMAKTKRECVKLRGLLRDECIVDTGSVTAMRTYKYGLLSRTLPSLPRPYCCIRPDSDNTRRWTCSRDSNAAPPCWKLNPVQEKKQTRRCNDQRIDMCPSLQV